jgi:hypothetical protein
MTAKMHNLIAIFFIVFTRVSCILNFRGSFLSQISLCQEHLFLQGGDDFGFRNRGKLANPSVFNFSRGIEQQEGRRP